MKDNKRQLWKRLQMIKKVIKFPTVSVILILLIAVFFFNLVQAILAPGRITDDLRSEMEHSSGKIMRIEVCYDFTPEDFHIKAMQSYGSIAGVSNNSIFLMYVTTDNIERLSQIYWVDQIRLPE